MAIFKLNNLSKEEKDKYYSNLQNKIQNDSNEQMQRAIRWSQEATNKKAYLAKQVNTENNNNSSNSKSKKIESKTVAPTKTNKEDAQTDEVKKQIEEVSKAGVNTNNSLRGNTAKAPLARNMQLAKPSDEVKEYEDNKGILYKITNGEIDDRSDLQKNVDYLSHSAKTGVTKGVTGIGQGVLTTVANEADKGKNENTGDIVKQAVTGISPGIGFWANIGDYGNRAKEIWSNNKKSGWDKISETATLGAEAGKNFIPGYNAATGIVQGLGKINDKLGESILELNEKIGEPAKKMQEENIKKAEKVDSATKFIGKGLYSVGNMTPSVLATLITKNPTIGLALMGESAKGQATQEALEAGKDLNTAVNIGDVKRFIEVATEKISGGTKVFGKGSLDDIAEDFIKNKAKSKFGQFLMKQGYNTLGEITEEEISNLANNIIDKGTVDPNRKIINLQEILETAGDTAFSTTLLNALTGGMVGDYKEAKYQTQQDQNTHNLINREQDIVNQENSKQILPAQEIKEQEQNTQQNQTNPIPPVNIQQESNVVAPVNNQQNIQNEISTQKPNKINEAVQNYIANKNGNFNSEISIETKNLYDGTPIDYNKVNQSVLAKKAQSLVDRFKKRIFQNNGENIYVTNGDIKKSISETLKNKEQKQYKLENLAVFSQIESIISNGKEIAFDPNDNEGRPYKDYKYYVSDAYIDGQPMVVEFDTRVEKGETGKDERHFRLERVYPLNNKEVVSNTVPKVTSDSTFLNETTSFINNSIPPTNQNVNSDTITNNYTQNYENNAPIAKNIQEETNPTRHDVIQKYRNLAKENIENISTWKDKKIGLSYQLETMERNMYDIIPDKAEAQRVNETYFEPIHESEAQKQKFINSYNEKIKNLNLNKYESEAVQLLGEQKYNPDFKASEVQEILDKVNNNIERGKVDKQKVEEAIETFRNIYDELFELENQVLRENGYKEKPYRKGYFPHFIDYVPETKTEKVLNKLGFKIDKRPLPTDIAGITEQFVPGKTWNRSALERKGNKTDYNALKGFDTYIAQASDNIFHTENIQRLRGLENEIRFQYSDKGVQNRINEILNNEILDADEKQDMIDIILKQVDNPMPNLVTELRRYTNALANKKSEADRKLENRLNRSIYSTVNAIENRFGANAVGLNIGSAVTNFIPITQAWSQVSTKNMGRAVIDTVKSYLNNDGFVDKSAFLTSRVNQSEKLYKTSIEKISDKTSFLFNAIDEVTSNIVVRGKYLENIQKGMSENEAIKNADQFARNVMADRSKGALPTIFEEKNPITKAFTQFQLEVNNQYRYMFKDLPRDLAEKGLGAIALAFFKMFIGAWIYNEASEKVTGRRPAFDPIDIATSAYKNITDEKKGTYDKIASIRKDITEELPFVGGFAGGGRIPVNGAIPDVANLTKAGVGLATGEMDSKKAISNIGKEISKPLYYLVPPFGGGQLKKTKEGLETVINGGSYGVDSKRKRLASISCRRC